MKIRTNVLAGIALAATAALGLTACGSGSAPASSAAPDAEATSDITVYNAQHEPLTKEWIEAFTAETGITVALRQGKDTQMSQQLIAEGAESKADVFLTENSPAMTQVENAGLFADVDQATLEQVPAEYRPSTNKWTGIAARSTVLVYNKNKLTADQLPGSMLDLAKPEWKGKWAAAPAGADFQAIVSALLELKGEAATEEWLKAMKENVKAEGNNRAAMKAANAGTVDAALIYHYYYYSDQAGEGADSKDVATHYFRNQDPGAFVSVSGGGVLKNSKNPAAAQEFLKFITGKKGQEILQKGNSFEYAVASGVPSHEKLEPLAELQAPVVDPAKLNSAKVTELMTKAGLL